MEEFARWLTLYLGRTTPLEYEAAAVVARLISVAAAALLLFIAYRLVLALLQRAVGTRCCG